jgi:tetratricopeptide (TPR) repeat protein
VARFAATIPPIFGAVGVAGLAAFQGGYFPPAWGWATLLFLWVAAVSGIARSSMRLNPSSVGFVASLALVGAWIGASTLWSPSLTASVPEVGRVAVYVSAALALVTVVSRSSYVPFLGGVLAGITAVCSYSLSTRLFPDRLGVFDPYAIYRVSEPLGYWNALGLLAVVGIVLALGFVTDSRAASSRATAGATLVITLPTLYFTFGRGGWIALFAALCALLALSPARLWVTAASSVILIPAVAVVFIASGSTALTHRNAALGDAVGQGRRLALAVLVASAASAALAIVLARIRAAIRVPPTAVNAFGAAVLAVGILAAGAGIAAAGGPGSIVRRAYDEFHEPPPRPVDLNDRLRNLSGNGRAELWSIAWHQYRDSPWIGSGAGTYERYYTARREPGLPKVRDAHGLYIETLAELGAVGLAVLALTLSLPLVAAVRSRRSAVVPAAAAAYFAYLVHAAADWDWEMPVLTTVAIFCGGAIVVAAGRETVTIVGGRGRAAIATAAIVLAAPAAYLLLGEAALSEADAARRDGDVTGALNHARQATEVFPWSARAWVGLAEARVAAGDRRGALAAFRRAVAEDPGDWRGWLGIARTTSGSARAAALGRATALNPSGLDIAQFRVRIQRGDKP